MSAKIENAMDPFLQKRDKQRECMNCRKSGNFFSVVADTHLLETRITLIAAFSLTVCINIAILVWLAK